MQRQKARSATVQRLARVTHAVHRGSGWGARTVPVEDAHERHRLRRRVAPEGEADAAAVLVDLRGGLALADARLNAVARVGADGLDGEGQQRLRLDHTHFGAARHSEMYEPGVALRGAAGVP